MRGEVLAYPVRHHEELVRVEAEELFGTAHLIGAQRLAVRLRRVVLTGRSVTDMAVYDDDRRCIVGGKELIQGAGELAEIVRVRDPDDIPAIRFETLGDVLGEGNVGVAVNGHVVVVEDPAQVGQFEMPGQGRSFVADALHQAALAANGIDIVIEEFEVGLVVGRGQPFAGDGHADAGGDALAQRPGGRLLPPWSSHIRGDPGNGCRPRGSSRYRRG